MLAQRHSNTATQTYTYAHRLTNIQDTPQTIGTDTHDTQTHKRKDIWTQTHRYIDTPQTIGTDTHDTQTHKRKDIWTQTHRYIDTPQTIGIYTQTHRRRQTDATTQTHTQAHLETILTDTDTDTDTDTRHTDPLTHRHTSKPVSAWTSGTFFT